MNPNNPTDEELAFDEAAQISAQRAQETERRLQKASALSDEEKVSQILDLEDEKKQLENEMEQLDKQTVRLKSKNFKLSLCLIGSLLALGGVVSGFYQVNKDDKRAQSEIQTLRQELNNAALLDETNTRLVRKCFAAAIAEVGAQNADATPIECVKMATAYIKEQKSKGALIMENFQIRIVSEDLFALALSAEKTHTTTSNFLQAVKAYKDIKPDGYAYKSNGDATQEVVVQGRACLDALFLKAGQANHQNN